MRLRHRHVATALAAVVAAFLTGCSGVDTPTPPNGPNPQGFSTNNALLRIVNGSPVAGSACITPAGTTCVDVFVDGKLVAAGVPYASAPALDSFAILPYVSVPAGSALIQIFQSPASPGGPEGTLVYGAPVTISANAKYSFVLAGNAVLPPPAPPFFPGYLFKDGLYQAGFGAAMADFHNASFNAGSIQFSVTCASCPSGGQKFGNPIAAGSIVGPVNLVPSSNYAFVGTGASTNTLTAAQIDGLNTSGVIPDPFGKQNVSVYAVDTTGTSPTNWQLIAIEDTNG